LTLLWLLAAVAAAVAALAYIRTRRLARKLAHLTQSYWELKYQYGQLNARLARCEPEPEVESPSGSSTGFVPLSSIKR
jgi:hypothetical protein